MMTATIRNAAGDRATVATLDEADQVYMAILASDGRFARILLDSDGCHALALALERAQETLSIRADRMAA